MTDVIPAGQEPRMRKHLADAHMYYATAEGFGAVKMNRNMLSCAIAG
jgi:hypothetical protein